MKQVKDLKTVLHFKKNNNDITDIISYPASLNTMPKINMDSKCQLAFKLMIENSLDKLLVEDNNKKIIGVIDEDNLLKAVLANTFEAKIKKFVTTKVKKIKHDLRVENLLLLFKKEKF